MAQLTADRAVALGMAVVMLQIVQHYLAPAFILVVATSVAAQIARKAPASTLPWGKLAELGFLSGAMLLPVFVLQLMTGTDDRRRVFVGMAFAALCLVIAAARPGARSKLRIGMLCLLASLQVATFFIVADGYPVPASLRAIGLTGTSFPRPHFGPDLNVATINELRRMGVPERSAVGVWTLALYDFPARVYEPAALTLASVTLGNPVDIFYFWDRSAYDAVIDGLAAQRVKFLLLDSFDSPTARQRSLPYVKFAAALRDRVEKNGPSNLPKLRLMGQFRLGNRAHWLFEIPRDANVSVKLAHNAATAEVAAKAPTKEAKP